MLHWILAEKPWSDLPSGIAKLRFGEDVESGASLGSFCAVSSTALTDSCLPHQNDAQALHGSRAPQPVFVTALSRKQPKVVCSMANHGSQKAEGLTEGFDEDQNLGCQ